MLLNTPHPLPMASPAVPARRASLTRFVGLMLSLGIASAAAGQELCPGNINKDWVPIVEDTGPNGPNDPEGECDLTQEVIVPDGLAELVYRWHTEQEGGLDLANPNTWSCCWDNVVAIHGGEALPAISPDQTYGEDGGFRLPTGFRFNFDLLRGPPSIGDFLPPSPTIGGSSVALLPSGAGALPTGWQGVGRPTLAGVADLMTGLPLIQTTDLELPFGGATFRLTRTRSGITDLHHGGGNIAGTAGQGMWWDWAGAGWMIGENPLLLIDSALPDLVGPYPRTTWLVLDAHHAIPFQQVNLPPEGDDPRIGYEAPPRFRARMRHNGTWGIVKGPYVALDQEIYGWIEPPTQYEIWLYDGLVKYTFVAVRPPLTGDPEEDYVPPFGDDVPLKRWDAGDEDEETWMVTSYHDLPEYDGIPYSSDSSPGFGIPYYGLCTRIEDRHGHVAEISYCSGIRTPVDSDEDDCIECHQHCLRKGMISHVQLKHETAEGQVTAWTLLYTYRLFKGGLSHAFGSVPMQDWLGSQPAEEDVPAWRGSAAIDRIYAYEGDFFADNEVDPACAIIGSSDNPYGEMPLDPLTEFYPGAETEWVYEVRNWYRTETWPEGAMERIPMLIRTTVTSRDQLGGNGEGIPGTERQRDTVYRYRDNPALSIEDAENGPFLPFLDRVYTDEDYQRLRAWSEDPGDDDDDEAIAAWFVGLEGIHEFAVADRTSESGEHEANLTTPQLERLRGFASICLTQKDELYGGGGHWPTDGVSWAPWSSGIINGGYISVANTRLVADTSLKTVGAVTVQGGNGPPKHYKLHRMLVLPDDVDLWGGDFVTAGFGSLGVNPPKRSLFYHPFRFCSVGDVGLTYPDGSLDAANLEEARYINIIDEFVSRDAMTHTVNQYSEDSLAIKAGQRSRRVVEINAAGHILRDTTWEYTEGGVLVSGGGIGERFIYDSIEDLFSEDGVIDDLAALIVHSTPGAPALDPVEDIAEIRRQAGGFLRDLLLVERRSVGWSAAELAEVGATEGVIDFFDYHWFDTTETPDLELPWRSRVQLVATGIKKGTGGDRIYTRQFFRSDDHPWDVEADVEFLSEAAGASMLGSPPNAEEGADSYKVSRWVTEREESVFDLEAPESEWPVKKRVAIGPPRQLEPGGGWHYPVEAQFMDVDNGQLDWSATGLVTNPDHPADGPGDLDSLIFTFFQYDGKGRLHYMVADASGADVPDPSSTSEPQGTLPVDPWPEEDSWSRIPEVGGLDQVTLYYHDKYGPTDIFLPNKSRWARRTVKIEAPPELEDFGQPEYAAEPGAVPDPDDLPGVGWTSLGVGDEPFIREYIFNDLRLNDGTLTASSPGEVRDYAGLDPGGSPVKVRKVEFTKPDGEDPGSDEDEATFVVGQGFLQNPDQIGQPFFRSLAKVELRPDQYGRMANADLFELNSDGVDSPVGSQQINDLGEVFRTRDMDGTITRVTKNSLGQALRRYVGSIDDKWLNPEDLDNDLVLVERTEHGLSPNDAWMPTIVRRYTTNQGFTWHLEFYGDPPTSDPHGQATITSYDWRMRPVRVDVYETGDLEDEETDRLTTTLTFLDHANRTRITVSYGPGTLPTLGSGMDPALRDPAATLPAAADFLTLGGLKPLSITEHIYGPGGDATETRSYDVAWNGQGAAPFHADYQFTGFGGQTVFRQSPGSGATLTELDGLARPIAVKTVVPQVDGAAMDYDFEVARTDYAYDDDGNQQVVTRWERIVDAMSAAPAAPELSATNSVCLMTLNWYDVRRRLVASADLGTQQTKFISNGQAPTVPGWFDPLTLPSINPADGTLVNVDGIVPATVPLTVYHYDRRGNLDLQADPLGVITKTTYTGTGKVWTRTEDAFGAEPRETVYEYRFGRLFGILAERDANQSQSTENDFGLDTEGGGGAEVVDTGDGTGFEVVSHHGAHVYALRLPDPSTGLAGATASISMRYDFAGRLAERTDERGISIRYRYDDLDRLRELEVGWYDGASFTPGYPPSVLYADALEPPSRIGYILYEYADDMRTYTATARSKKTGGELISQVKQEYDGRGNLAKDWQSFGETITSGTPKTGYDWDAVFTDPAATPGRSRLAGMDYPRYSPGDYLRTLDLGFGAAETMPDALGHVRLMESTKNAVTKEVAGFGWVGTGRRAWRTLAEEGGPNVGGTQDFLHDAVMELQGGQIGLLGLDPWGRTVTLSYHTGGPSQTLNLAGSFAYSYDLAGRRTGVNRIPDPWASQPNFGTEKHTNIYDGLSRLTHFKATNSNASIIRIEQDWDLDLLGNWTDRDTSTPTPATTVSHAVDERNRIESVETLVDGQSPVTAEFKYDAAGNMAFDGTYAFQYDAWNRLVQVNRAQLDVNEDIVLDELVKHHTYDALGRLARTLSPYPDPDTSDGELRSERFYYDGIRRLVEVDIDTVLSLQGALDSQDNDLIALANGALALSDGDIDPSAAPAAFEVAIIAETSPTITTAREYIWGPGDRGIYELLCQFDSTGDPLWIMQDEGGDVIGACDANGPSGAARIVGLWSYGPYGEVVQDATIVAHAKIHAGHKGLFLDRLDEGIVSGGNEVARLVAGATHTAFANNRHLLPKYGRWAQADPNASGLALLARASAGQGLSADADWIHLESMYGDGASLYQYGRSSPWMGGDPMGLEWNPFDWYVDQYLAEDAGSKAAFLDRVIGTVHTAAYLTTYFGSFVPGPIGLAAGLANSVMGLPSSLHGTAFQGFLGAADQVAVGVNLGRMGVSMMSAGARYVTQLGLRAAPGTGVRGVVSLARRINSWEGDHHIVPLYMRGADVARNMVHLTHREHVDLHSLIDAIGMERYRIPRRAGAGGGRAAVDNWLLRNPRMGPSQLRMTLTEACLEFDRLHPGKNVTMKLWHTIMYDHPGLQ